MITLGKNILTSTVLTSAIGLMVIAGSAQASQPKSFIQNATGACQPPLPSFDKALRRGVYYVSNITNSNAVATCSLMGTDLGSAGDKSITSAFVNLINLSASAVDVTCTMVDGYFGTFTYLRAKTLTLPANSSVNEYRWTAADNGGRNYLATINVACALAPGTAIGLTGVYWEGIS